jgi:hypothetical protein
MMKRPGEMGYGKDIINQTHKKQDKLREYSLNHTVKLRSGNNYR